jgi:ribonuclease P protein component
VSLPKSQRLVSQIDITKVLRSRYKNHTDLFSLYFSDRVANGPKFQVIVPKKVFKKAHDRNSIKRRVMAIFRENINTLSKQNKSIILLVRSSTISKLPALELQAKITNKILESQLYKRRKNISNNHNTDLPR